MEAEEAVKERISKILNVNGRQSVDTIHKKFGSHLWELVGMERNKEGLKSAIDQFKELKEEFWTDVRVPGDGNEMNPELEKAGRVADFIEIGELMAMDALQREESCGGHFRKEYQTEEGEAKRNDKDFMYVGAWEYKGPGKEPQLHKEPLIYENIEVKQRDYKK